MTQIGEYGPQPVPEVKIGERLPGLVVMADRPPEGFDYRDQVISTDRGDLFFDLEQWPNGTVRWVTNHGETLVLVESGSGKVLAVDDDYRSKHNPHDADTYAEEGGMRAYHELRRRIAAGDYPEGLLGNL